jgi:hypothetical protein
MEGSSSADMEGSKKPSERTQRLPLTVDLHLAAIVIDVAEISEAIQKETYSRASRIDHLGKGFLTHFSDDQYGL